MSSVIKQTAKVGCVNTLHTYLIRYRFYFNSHIRSHIYNRKVLIFMFVLARLSILETTKIYLADRANAAPESNVLTAFFRACPLQYLLFF